MLTPFTPKNLFAGAMALLALGCLLAAFGTWRAEAQPVEKDVQRYDGASSCMDCHAQPTAARGASLPFVMLDEYAIWKTLDKHAQAYAVLKNERGERMSKLLRGDGKAVLKGETGCLNCHAMNLYKTSKSEEFNPEDGVSCAGCHGPSSGWLTDHAQPAWRKLTPEQKAEKGMVNLRDSVKRAELCASCHVGNAAEGMVVTHDMYAAGHPPLPPYELATFSESEPQHWREPKDVPFFFMLRDVGALADLDADARKEKVREIIERYRKTKVPNAEVTQFVNLYKTSEDARKVLDQYPFAGADTRSTRLALIGNVVALRETMKLVVDRANQGAKADPKWLWPELLAPAGKTGPSDAELRKLAVERWSEVAMAHSDCYACHYDLQYPGYRQKRGYGYRLPGGGMIPTSPGRVQIRSWPLAMLEPAVKLAGRGDGNFKGNVARLAEDLRAMAKACDDRPFGEPARVAQAAQKLMGWCDALQKQLKSATLDQKELRALLKDLTTMDALAYADCESARQITSLFAVGYGELKDKDEKGNAVVAATMARLENDVNLRPYINRARRIELIRNLVKKLTGQDPKDMDPFIESVQHNDNMDLLLKMRTNGFLSILRTDIENAQMNEALQKDVVNKLEHINDKELDDSAKKIAAFDPVLFRERMKKLGEAISGR